MTSKATPAVSAAPGIVKIQAQTILSVTPQRTADRRLAAPTPEMAPVMTWVVLTGTPAWVAKKMLMALAVSAQKPSIGRSLVIFWPMVLTMRQPPESVPKAMAAWAARTTQSGMVKVLIQPAAKIRLAMIPMVFWASLPPWPRL